MSRSLASKLLLVGVGAGSFLLLSSYLKQNASTPPRVGAGSAAAVPLDRGASATATPAVTALAPSPAPGPQPVEATAPAVAPADPSKLTDAEIADVMQRAEKLMLSGLRSLETEGVDDLEKYLLNLRTVTKTQAVPEKLATGKYELLPPVDLFTMQGETTDQTILAFSIARGVVRIAFTRDADVAVFAAIDTSAAGQQASWDLAVKQFNERPQSEREELIAAHRRSETQLSTIYAEIEASAQSTGPLEAARARHEEITRLQKGLLPFYLVVPRGSTTAWARRSIGR